MYGDIEIYHSNIKTLHFLKLCSISVMYFALQLKKNKLLIASIFIIAAQLNIDIPISGLIYSQNAGCAGFLLSGSHMLLHPKMQLKGPE